jgi:translation initiation factor 5B
MSEEQKIAATIEGAGEGEDGKKLTAGQKKKLKEK